MDGAEHDELSFWFSASLLLLSLLSAPFYLRLFRRIQPAHRNGRSWLDAAVPPRPQTECPLGLIDVVIIFICWFLVQSIAMAIAIPVQSQAGMANSISPGTLVVASLGQLTGTFLGVGIICFRYRRGLRIFGWQPEFLIADTKLALIAFCMTLPGLLLIQAQLSKWIPYRHGTLEMLVDHFDLATVAATWLSAGLIAPLTEELFFRATLQGWLQRLHRGMSEIKFLLVISGGNSAAYERVMGADALSADPFAANSSLDASRAPADPSSGESRSTWLPILLSATAFGGVHFGQGAAPIALFLFGIVLGILYRQRGSLWACVVLHALLNGFTLFWANVQMWFNTTNAL